MAAKMPCHISDGPQTPEDVIGFAERDEDEEYEFRRQEQIDDAFAREQARKLREEKIK